MKKWMWGVLEVVVLGVVIFLLIQLSPASQKPEHQSATSDKTPFATLDTASLSATSASQNIMGTCGNVSGNMAIIIVQGKTSLPFYTLPAYPGPAVFKDYTDREGQFDALCRSTNGTFSTRYASPQLQKGIYTVGIYMFQNVYTEQGFTQNAGVKLLTSGTLTVN